MRKGVVAVTAALVFGGSWGETKEPPIFDPWLSTQTVAFSPDGKYVALGLSAGRPVDTRKPLIRVFEVDSGKEIRGFDGHTDTVPYVAFTPDSKSIVSIGNDATYRRWDVRTGKLVRVYTLGEEEKVGCSGSLSADGKMVLASRDNSLIIWDAQRGTVLHHLKLSVPRGGPGDGLFSPDGKLLYIGGKLIELKSEKILRSFNTVSDEHSWWGGPAFTLDSRCIVREKRERNPDTEKSKFHLIVWDIRKDEEVYRFGRREITGVLPNPYYRNAMTFLPDGKRLLINDGDTVLRCWDMDRDKEVWSVPRVSHPTVVSGGKQFLVVTAVPAKFFTELRIELRNLSDGSLVREVTHEVDLNSIRSPNP